MSAPAESRTDGWRRSHPWRIVSYLIYVVALETLVVGGCGYAVFALGHSGWWFLLAALFSSSFYPPERWSALWDDAIANKYRVQKNSASSQPGALQ